MRHRPLPPSFLLSEGGVYRPGRGGRSSGAAMNDRAPAAPKIVLLVRLLAALDEGRSYFEELKARIGGDVRPSTRTLRRYLATLAEAGFPWFYDRAGGTYRLEAGYSLRRHRAVGGRSLRIVDRARSRIVAGRQIGASVGEVTEKLTRVADRESGSAARRPAMRVQVLGPRTRRRARRTFRDLAARPAPAAERPLLVPRQARPSVEAPRRPIRVRRLGRTHLHGRPGPRPRREARLCRRFGFRVRRSPAAIHDAGRLRHRGLRGELGKRDHARRRTDDRYGSLLARGRARGGSGTHRPRTRDAPVAGRFARDRLRRVRPLEIVRWTLKWGAEAESSGRPRCAPPPRKSCAKLARRYGASGK